MLLKTILTILLLVGISSCKKPPQTKQQEPSFDIITAKAQLHARNDIFNGTLLANKVVQVIPRVEGILKECNISKDTPKVKKGTILFKIEDDIYKIKVASCQANFNNAQANYNLTNTDFERKKKLLEQNAISKSEYDIAEANQLIAKAQLQNSKAQLDEAKLKLSWTEIKADCDAWVGINKFDVGNFVSPASGSLVELIDNSYVEIEFFVPQNIIIKARLNNKESNEKTKDFITPYLILTDGTELKSQGELVFLNNKVDANTDSLQARARFKNPATTKENNVLFDQAYAKVRLEFNDNSKIILIPQVAILEDVGGRFIYTLNKDDIIEKRKVITGEVFANDVEIITGLNENDRVIISNIKSAHIGNKAKIASNK